MGIADIQIAKIRGSDWDIAAHLGMGNEPDQALTADADRRREKAQILKDFHDEVKGFIKKAAYVSGSGPDSNKRLEQALEPCVALRKA